MLKRLLFFTPLLFLAFISVSYASVANESITQMTNNVDGVMHTLTKVLEDISLIAGIGFLFAAIIQYQAHRVNPSQVRLTKPISYVVFGIILILFPFVGYLTTYHPAMISF